MSHSDQLDYSLLSNRDDRWMLADEQFELFIASLQVHGGRRTRLQREAWETPPEVAERQQFDEETEQMRRVIAVERARWFAAHPRRKETA